MEIFVESAVVKANAAFTNFRHLCGDLLKEVAIVGDDEDGAVEAFQSLYQDLP